MQGVKGTGSVSERNKRWRAKHPGAQLAASNAWRKNRPGYLGPKRQTMADRVVAIKEATPCADCGNRFPACCMDFDHVRGGKIAGVSQLVALSKDWTAVEAEILKCELVCANCHRIRTQARRRQLEKDEAPKGQIR